MAAGESQVLDAQELEARIEQASTVVETPLLQLDTSLKSPGAPDNVVLGRRKENAWTGSWVGMNHICRLGLLIALTTPSLSAQAGQVFIFDEEGTATGRN